MELPTGNRHGVIDRNTMLQESRSTTVSLFRKPTTRRLVAIVLAGGALVSLAAVAAQQREWNRRGRRGISPESFSENVPYDGRFVFVRLRYPDGGFFGRGNEPGWAHDYPRAERNLMKILNELTLIAPYLDGGNILALDDPELFNFPFAYMSEPGFWTMSDAEASHLRSYLRKGGFLIFDDFRGWHWQNFEEQMRRVLPDVRFVELDATHPIFHSFFEIDSLDFVQAYDRGERPVFYGVFDDNDPKKRLMIIANYNNDIGEYWEYSDTGLVPINLSNEAYKLGVNYVVYAMTH